MSQYICKNCGMARLLIRFSGECDVEGHSDLTVLNGALIVNVVCPDCGAKDGYVGYCCNGEIENWPGGWDIKECIPSGGDEK